MNWDGSDEQEGRRAGGAGASAGATAISHAEGLAGDVPARADSPAPSGQSSIYAGTLGTMETQATACTAVSSTAPLVFDIRPRDYYLYYVTVPAVGDILKWSFWTRKKNIAFGLYYLHTAGAPSEDGVGEAKEAMRAATAAGRLTIWPPPKGTPASATPPTGPGLSRSNSMLMAKVHGSDVSLGTLPLSQPTPLSSSTTALDERAATPFLPTATLPPDQSDFLGATVAFERARRLASEGLPEGSPEGAQASPIEFVEVLPAERYESFENTINGSFKVPLAGVYVLCFDNTFSIHTSKQVSLLTKTVQVPRLVPTSAEAQPADSAAQEAFEAAAQYAVIEEEHVLLAGWMLKKKRKKIQGWARRWVQIDRAGILSYSEYRGSPSRGSVDVRQCAVSRVPHRRLITLDSEVTFHLRALSVEDFDVWSATLNSFHHHHHHHQHHHPTEASGLLADMGLREQKVYSAFTPDEVSQLATVESSLDMRMDALRQELARLKALTSQEEGVPLKYLGPLETSFGAVEELFHGLRQYSAHLRALHREHVVYRDDYVGVPEHVFSGALESAQAEEEVFYDTVLSDVSESEYTDADQFERLDDLSLAPPPATPSPVLVVAGQDRAADALFRTRLPSPAPPCNVSLASILRKSIGKDSSSMVMPIALNEPLNGLQRLCEELEYSELLDRAAAQEDPLERLVLVAAFAVSAYASTGARADRKPFNPMLGETYEYVEAARGLRYVSEKVSHRPLVLACHAAAPQWCWWQEQKVKTKFWGKSVEYIPAGNVHVTMGEDHFRWSKVVSCLRNVLGTKKWIEHYGEMTVVNVRNGDEARLTFKSSGGSFFSSSSSASSEVTGVVVAAADGRTVQMTGRWDDLMMRETQGDRQGWEVVWKANPLPPHHQEYYGFGVFATRLNQLLPQHADDLPPSDTRLRPDQRLMEHARVDEAEGEMMRLVERQRQARTQMEAEEQVWAPRWFSPTGQSGTGDEWVFGGQYWEARERKDWSRVPTLW